MAPSLRLFPLALAAAALPLSGGLAIGQTASPAPKVTFPAPSPAATLTQKVGLTDIAIEYSRPSTHGRPIFGALEPYGAVWRTGANTATTVTFSTAVKLNGIPVPAGKYALFTIPDPIAWTVILNRTSKQWGAFTYDAKADIARIKVAPVTLPASVDTFAIDFSDLTDDSANLNLSWAQTKVPIHVTVDVVPQVLAQIDAALADPSAKKPGFYLAAANFVYDHGHQTDKALQLVNQFIAVGDKYAYEGMYLKAEILIEQGDKAGAAEICRRGKADSIKSEGPTNHWLEMFDALLVGLNG